MATSRSGAGGKIVSNRRKQRLSSTPYDRPPPPPSPSPPPPPPTKSPNWFRFLASGAGKFLNYIFNESEPSSSEDEGSASEDDIDNENLYETPFNEVDTLDEENVLNTETKWTIEQLIMQADFSREESDKLKKVLDSRVTESGKNNFFVSPGKTFNHEDADMYNKAVQEAKRWFEEKKAGSSSVAELAHGTSNLNSTGLGHMETEGGSPVDVARSYMKERPPWSSPTKSFELKTPLTTTMKLFKERTLDSVSSKKRNSLVSGSWNIQEELRRVRSKATEDMLRSPPAKIVPSLFQVGSNQVESFGAGEGLFAFQPVSRNNENSEADPVEGEFDNAKSLRPSSSNHAEEHHTGPSLSDVNGVPTTKVTAIDQKQNVNGFSSSQTSLSAGQHDDENHNTDIANDKKAGNIVNEEGVCELLSEAYMEIPIVTEDSQNSMGMQTMQYEELVVDMSDEKAEIVAGKQQQTRKSGRNSRRGRGRGK